MADRPTTEHGWFDLVAELFDRQGLPPQVLEVEVDAVRDACAQAIASLAVDGTLDTLFAEDPRYRDAIAGDAIIQRAVRPEPGPGAAVAGNFWDFYNTTVVPAIWLALREYLADHRRT